MLFSYRNLKAENERLRAENEALKAQVDKQYVRVVRQWENFLEYDGKPQGDNLNED